MNMPPQSRSGEESQMVGFFYSQGGDYRCIILDKTRRDPKRSSKTFVEEFRAETPADLVAVCEEAGYDIGSPERVQELCESAPHGEVRRLH